MRNVKKWLYIALLLLSVTTHAQTSDVATDQQFTYYLYAAQAALDGGRYDDALALSEFAVRLKPTDPAVNYFLGVLYEGTHRTEAALKAYEIAYQGSPNDYWERYYRLLVATTDNENDNLRKAEKVLKAQHKREPQNTDVLMAMQEMALMHRNISKALRLQDDIDKIEGKTPQNVLRRYQLTLMTGKPDKAAAVIESYCREDPDDEYFPVFLGDHYCTTGNSQRGYELYQAILSDNPENPYVYRSLARYYATHGDDHAARLSLEKLVDIAPEGQVLEQYFDLLLKDTTVTREQQVAFIQKAYLMEPGSAKWHYYWGLALASKPADENQNQNDNQKEALKVLEEGIRLGEKDAVTRFSMHVLSGDLWMRLGDLDSCYAHYERALALDPDNIYVLNNYAYTLAVNGGDLKKAEKMSQKTIEKEPNNATYLDTYAWILHLQGQDALAKFYMLRAMEKANVNVNDNANDNPENEELKQHYDILFNTTKGNNEEP